MKRIFLIMALALPLSAQTVTVEVDTSTAEGKAIVAQADSIRTAALATRAFVTKTWVDSTVAADSLDFSTIGMVSIVADTVDPQWVQVDLPLASSFGITQKFVAAVVNEAKRDFGGKDSDTVGRVRLRKDRAVGFLRALDAALK